MGFKEEDHKKEVKMFRESLKPTSINCYYYRENNSIWYSSEGDGIFVAEIRVNHNYESKITIDSIVTALNEMMIIKN